MSAGVADVGFTQLGIVGRKQYLCKTQETPTISLAVKMVNILLLQRILQPLLHSTSLKD